MTDSPEAQPAQPPDEVYGIFAGPIDQGAVARIGSAMAITSTSGVTHVHLAFQTSGGTVPDGVALYNLFRAMQIPLTLYNIGTVASAGGTAYLGANDRLVSSHGSFMIHKTTSPALGATSERLQAIAHSVVIDDLRTDAIFTAAKLRISNEQRDIHRYADLWLSADEALKAGLATAIGEFAPPEGTQLFFLGPT
jgi:ATP-dependent Clp protease, protease subunit